MDVSHLSYMYVTFNAGVWKLAYTLQCLNNLFFQKQYENGYISTLVNSMDPDQLAAFVNSVDPDQLASEEAS